MLLVCCAGVQIVLSERFNSLSTLTRPQSSSHNAPGGSRGWWKGKRSLSLAFVLAITPLAPLRRDRERRLGTSQLPTIWTYGTGLNAGCIFHKKNSFTNRFSVVLFVRSLKMQDSFFAWELGWVWWGRLWWQHRFSSLFSRILLTVDSRYN